MNERATPRRPEWIGFVLRGLVVYLGWYLLYDRWLLPQGQLDTWLSEHVAMWAGGLLKGLGQQVDVMGRTLRLPPAPGVFIENGCNGLAAMGLFMGFVVAYPGSWRRRAWFIPLGAGILLAVNLLRVTVLALVQRDAPGVFAAAHEVGAQTIFYVAVFALWIVWARTSDRAAAAAPPKTPIATPPEGLRPVVG
jgi:exosortase/archaeosortase family protein